MVTAVTKTIANPFGDGIGGGRGKAGLPLVRTRSRDPMNLAGIQHPDHLFGAGRPKRQ